MSFNNLAQYDERQETASTSQNKRGSAQIRCGCSTSSSSYNKAKQGLLFVLKVVLCLFGVFQNRCNCCYFKSDDFLRFHFRFDFGDKGAKMRQGLEFRCVQPSGD